MRHSHLVRAALAIALALPGAAACDVSVGEGGFSLDVAHGRAQDTWTRSYPLAAGARFELINVNGRITAEPAEGETVEVSAERNARASTEEAAKQLLDQIEMREEVGSSKVRVEVRAPRRFGMSGAELKWTVKVPPGVTVDLRTTNGKVSVNGLSGEVHARTVNGGVEGRDLAASSVEASAVNGGLDIQISKPLPADGLVSLKVVNGGVSLAIPSESRASVTARVTNGGVNTTGLDLALVGEQTRRRMEGTLNGGGARVGLETVNGGVRLTRTTIAAQTSR